MMTAREIGGESSEGAVWRGSRVKRGLVGSVWIAKKGNSADREARDRCGTIVCVNELRSQDASSQARKHQHTTAFG